MVSCAYNCYYTNQLRRRPSLCLNLLHQHHVMQLKVHHARLLIWPITLPHPQVFQTIQLTYGAQKKWPYHGWNRIDGSIYLTTHGVYLMLLPNTKGKEWSNLKCMGGTFSWTIVLNSCSSIIKSHRVQENCKCAFESILHSFGFSVMIYYGENGNFHSQAFKDDCNTDWPQICFSGSCAHSQNGVA